MSRFPTTAEIAALSCELYQWIHNSNNHTALADALNFAVEQYDRERDALVHSLGHPDDTVPPASSAVVNAVSLFAAGVKKTTAVALDALTANVTEQLKNANIYPFAAQSALYFFNHDLNKIEENWQVANSITLTRASFKTIVIAKIQRAYFESTTKAADKGKSNPSTQEALKPAELDGFDFVEACEATLKVSDAVYSHRHIKPLEMEGCAEKIFMCINAIYLGLGEPLNLTFDWIKRSGTEEEMRKLIKAACEEYDKARASSIEALGVASEDEALSSRVMNMVRTSYMTCVDAALTNSSKKVRDLFQSEKSYYSLFWGLGEFAESDWKHQGHALLGYAGRPSLKTIIMSKLVEKVSATEAEKVLTLPRYAEMFYVQLHALRYCENVNENVNAHQPPPQNVMNASF